MEIRIARPKGKKSFLFGFANSNLNLNWTGRREGEFSRSSKLQIEQKSFSQLAILVRPQTLGAKFKPTFKLFAPIPRIYANSHMTQPIPVSPFTLYYKRAREFIYSTMEAKETSDSTRLKPFEAS